MDIEFKNLKELRERIEPALSTKLTELKRNNYNLITKDDIWNFLKENKWKEANNLTLYDIINDVMNIDNEKLDTYVKGSDFYEKNKTNIN